LIPYKSSFKDEHYLSISLTVKAFETHSIIETVIICTSSDEIVVDIDCKALAN
jgi:hypothetical protein